MLGLNPPQPSIKEFVDRQRFLLQEELGWIEAFKQDMFQTNLMDIQTEIPETIKNFNNHIRYKIKEIISSTITSLIKSSNRQFLK